MQCMHGSSSASCTPVQTSIGITPAMAEQQLSFAHLPDGSQELAAAADLPLTLDACTLPLHSQVLAAGSRVLRTSLCGTRAAAGSIGGERGGGVESGGGLDPTAAAAVQRAFEGHSLQDVQQFLKFLYSPVAVAAVPASLAAFRGVILLADKLDAPVVLQVRWGACVAWHSCGLATFSVIFGGPLSALSWLPNLHCSPFHVPSAGLRLAPGALSGGGLAGLAAPGRCLRHAAPAAQGGTRPAYVDASSWGRQGSASRAGQPSPGSVRWAAR